MTRTSLARYPCPVARAAEVVGDKWSMLIVRDALMGVTRFSDFKVRLGVAANILTERLKVLVDAGVLHKRPVRPGVQRVEYVLTEKGRDLAPVVIALLQWGERWAFKPGQTPVTVQAKDTGEPLAPIRFQTASGHALDVSDLELIATAAAPDTTRRSYAALKARALRGAP